MYRINEIPMKIPMICFVETEKSILRFTWNLKGPRIGNKKTNSPEEAEQSWRTQTSWSHTYVHWRNDRRRPMDRTENPEINKLSQRWSSDFQQSCQDHSMGRGQTLQQTELGKLDIHVQKRSRMRNYHHTQKLPQTKCNSWKLNTFIHQKTL